LAHAIVEAADVKEIQLIDSAVFNTLPGMGVEAVIEGKKILLGNGNLMQRFQFSIGSLGWCG